MTSSALPRWLMLLCLSACAPAKQDAAPAVSAANQGSSASAACGATASATATATSKVRHIPDENDPCAESRGLPPR
ncbi:hypothetical protein GTP56_23265 [Duganella sp. FT134W]|uniref:Uncharacterized protein n=1 Tax=Duganella margarita TaxID=2692170 RepID=A0A7X4H4C4_9BURK|nr:hypothetical protein [Duganella margarita]MYM75093.1 hypothetical protein [Duganella margarita]